MIYVYYHDAENRIVYCVPDEPIIHEQRDSRQRLVGRSVSMNYDITRADNVLVGSQWKHPVMGCPNQYFDNRYNRQQVISYFKIHHNPKGVEIDEERYRLLKAQYETQALQNR
jgi:hypothetical protein